MKNLGRGDMSELGGGHGQQRVGKALVVTLVMHHASPCSGSEHGVRERDLSVHVDGRHHGSHTPQRQAAESATTLRRWRHWGLWRSLRTYKFTNYFLIYACTMFEAMYSKYIHIDIIAVECRIDVIPKFRPTTTIKK